MKRFLDGGTAMPEGPESHGLLGRMLARIGPCTAKIMVAGVAIVGISEAYKGDAAGWAASKVVEMAAEHTAAQEHLKTAEMFGPAVQPDPRIVDIAAIVMSQIYDSPAAGEAFRATVSSMAPCIHDAAPKGWDCVISSNNVHFDFVTGSYAVTWAKDDQSVTWEDEGEAPVIAIQIGDDFQLVDPDLLEAIVKGQDPYGNPGFNL